MTIQRRRITKTEPKPALPRPSKCLGVLLAVIGTLSSVDALDVKQGMFGGAESSVFNSPMIITTALAATDRSLWGDGDWFAVDDYKNLGRFTCEGVSIRRDYDRRQQTWDSGLELAARVKSPGVVQLKARVSIYNPKHNQDKAVTVLFEIMDGDQVLKTATVGPIKVEDDGGEDDERVALLFPIGLLDKQPAPTLRLTVVAKND